MRASFDGACGRLRRVPLGLVAGLGLVLASACGDAKDRSADPFGPAVARLGDAVAAEIDGTPIYVSDVRRRAVADGVADSAAPLDPSGPRFNETLEDMIHERILALEAIRRGLDQTDEARRRIAAEREAIMSNILVETVVAEAVTEDVLRRMYDEQSKILELGDEVSARHIVVATREDADAIVKDLQAGKDFAQLALDRSIDELTRYEGGDLGYFGRKKLTIPELERRAFEAKVGEIAPPFRTELGWHVLKVEGRRAEQPPTFEEMRPKLVRFLTLEELRKLSDVLVSRATVRRYTGPAAAAEPEGAEPGSGG